MTAAANFGLMFRGRYYYILAGYDDGELARFGPGAVQLMDVMRYAIEHGCKLFDFTIGDEPYKREWCDIEIRLCDYVSPASLRGWLAAVADGGCAPRQAPHQAEPDGLGGRPQGADADRIAARLGGRLGRQISMCRPSLRLAIRNSSADSTTQAADDHDGDADAAVRAGHREASGQVQREHGGIDQRAAALLAQHVEHALGRADRGPRERARSPG